MPLSNIDRVRSLIGDLNKPSINELVAEGPVAGLQYQLDAFPVRFGSITAFVSGVARTATATTAQAVLGILDFTGVTTAVTAGAEVRVNYTYNALSDDEIQSTIDAVSGIVGDHVLLAASMAALGLAGNQARLYMYRQGDKLVDKDKIAEKLLKLSEALNKVYVDTIKYGALSMTQATNDSSGTFFENYDTGLAARFIDTGTTSRIW